MALASIPSPSNPIQTAQAHLKAERFDDARKIYDAIVAQAPDKPDGYVLLSRLAFEEGDRAACLATLRQALQRGPAHEKLWLHAAERFRAFDRTDEALAAYDKTIALNPKAIKPRADRAHYLQILGRFDAAEKAFRKLIKAAPNEPELYRMAMPTLSLKPADPLRRQMAQLWKNPRLSEAGRMHLGFALAQAETDPDREFALLERANGLQAKLAPFDATAIEREYAAVRAAQDGLTQSPQTPGRTPIFVMGAPRSGTTLVEQILAAHPDVTAGGEQKHGLATAYAYFGAADAMTRPDADGLIRYGQRYQTLLSRDAAGETAHFTDKSIMSHLIVGLLHAALPHARFVVVLRDPRDVAVSIYRNHFAFGTHRYANRFADIAFMIKAFRGNIAHWQATLPGLVHVVRYEDLVSDPETQSRALVEATGLDWDPACLTFHQAKGTVQTLSLAQVRQPIHSGRKEAWRKYEKHLAPFFDAWGETPWD